MKKKSAVPAIVKSTVAAPVKTAGAKRDRDTVFIRLNAAKLKEIIGDAEIGVSRKELKNFLIKKKSSNVFAEVGL